MLLATPALAQQSWDAATYNPKSADGDLVLPMPCGGAMAFRRIDTPAGPGALDDRQIVLGQAEAETNYAEFVRPEAVLGPFGGGATPRHYFLGKYEVTLDQWSAVLTEGCAATGANVLPKTGIGWAEAVSFADRYTQWLYKNAAAKLPGEGEAKGFLRLPTEAEWEYAARGGAKVGEAEFRARLFPMKEEVARYAWFQGPKSAAGQARGIGLLQPNPLGLHDMLGNAAELVLEPYRLNAVGRLHGEPGGMVLKGGDFRTPEDRLRSSLRVEAPPYNSRSGEPTRLSSAGLRLAIGGVVTTGIDRTAAFRQAFDALASRGAQMAEQPAALVERLAKESVDPAQKQGLGKLAEQLKTEARSRKELEARAAKAALHSGAMLVRSLRDYYGRAQAIRKIIADREKDGASKQTAEFKDALVGVEEQQRITMAAYVQLLLQVGDDIPAELVTAQLGILAGEFEQQRSPSLAGFAKRFAEQVAQYRKTRKADVAALLAEAVK